MRKTLDLRAYWALFCIKVALVTDPAMGYGICIGTMLAAGKDG